MDLDPSIVSVAQAVEQRLATLGDKEHVVLPVVALVEGVFTCANCAGPELYPAAAFARNPGAWNGRPITIGHPQRGGDFVSAADPDVWDHERIGTVFNARLDGDKLKLEAWVDPDAVKRAGKDAEAVLKAIEDGDEVEVSTAAWTDSFPKIGSRSGRDYVAVKANFQPDHVALLKLGDRGACNWQDGCGVRVAQWAPLHACCGSCATGGECECGGEHQDDADIDAAQTARTLERALEMALEDLVNGFVHVVDWDDGHVYYHADREAGLRRRGYTEDDGGVVALDENSERVRHVSEYVVAKEDSMADDKTKQAAQDQPARDAAKTDDKAAAADQAKPDAASTAASISSLEKRFAEMQAENEHLREKIDTLSKAPETVEDYINRAPEEIRGVFMRQYQAEHKRKLEMIDALKAAPGCMYSEDELKAMKPEDVEKLYSLARRGGGDYSVRPPEHSALAPLHDDDIHAPVRPSYWDKAPTGKGN